MHTGTTVTGQAPSGPEQLQGQGAGVVHQHLLAGHHVKLFFHQGVDQVPGQIYLALERWQCGNAPAFVGVVVFVGRTHGKSGHLVQEKIQTVVVVEHHHHVGLFLT
jgi:hypothetical protein